MSDYREDTKMDKAIESLTRGDQLVKLHAELDERNPETKRGELLQMAAILCDLRNYCQWKRLDWEEVTIEAFQMWRKRND